MYYNHYQRLLRNIDFIVNKGLLSSNKNFMLTYHRILLVFLLGFILFSCKKLDNIDTSQAVEMKDLLVSPDFNWETSHDVTFLIYSDKSTVIQITSEAADINYYKGFYNGLTGFLTVKLNFPIIISEVRINGTLVVISGDEVQVNLSNSFKSTSAYNPQDIPTNGLLAAWHFDENTGTTASDATGNHNGVINSASWVSGIRGSALQFDGNVSHIQIPNTGFNPVGNSISFSLWFRLNAVGNSGSFIYQNVKYNVSIDAQGRVGFALYTPLWKAVNSGYSSRILDTDWHHVVMTYDGTTMNVFLDGQHRTYTSNSGNLQSTPASVYIGKEGPINPFNGTIDEILMYNRALTDSEVLEIYGSTPDPGNGSDNLVSYWKFDENTGNIANDSKGSNHGIISGAAWSQGISGSCLTFNGTSGLVSAPSKLNLNPVYEITMMAWAKTENLMTTKIFQKGDYDGHGIGQGNWDGWGAQIRLASNITQGLHWGEGLPILNQWYHLAMTYDGQQMKLYVNGQLKNSKPVTGLLYVNSRNLSIGSDDGNQKFFKGSVDEPKIFNRALDQTEIQANYTQSGNSPDIDGDGVPNADDSYPSDPARAFNNYSPVVGFNTLAFEDLWPSRGDYDFNDLVLDYRFKIVTNSNNKVSEVYGTFVVKAIGAAQKNGFGFQLPGTGIADSDVEVEGIRLKENFINLNQNGTEAGQDKITVIVFDNVNKILLGQGGFGVNVSADASYVQPDTTTVSVIFKPNTYSITEVGIDDFNPFLIVSHNRGREIHLPDKPPTNLADPTFFNSNDDNSNPSLGKYYRTNTNLPWAIRISPGFDPTFEKDQITVAYLKFTPWVESSGSQFTDWYLSKTGYRDESKIFPVPSK